MALDLAALGKAIGEGLSQVGDYSAQAAAQANQISAAAQSAQGNFNQQSADLANLQNQQAMMNQYQYNSAMMENANAYNTGMWQMTANWNEAMWEKQAAFNAEQAQIQRDWQEKMANTQYQRAIKDMSKAGLNPILAVTGGGVGTGVPGGATASVGGASMSSAQSAMTSGGLLGANSASVSNYTGQMEYMAGTLGLISALISGLSTAAEASGQLGEVGEGVMSEVSDMLDLSSGKTTVDIGESWGKKTKDWLTEKYDQYFGNGNKKKTERLIRNFKNYTTEQPARSEGNKNWYFNKPLPY